MHIGWVEVFDKTLNHNIIIFPNVTHLFQCYPKCFRQEEKLYQYHLCLASLSDQVKYSLEWISNNYNVVTIIIFWHVSSETIGQLLEGAENFAE